MAPVPSKARLVTGSEVEQWLEQLRALEAQRRMLHAMARLSELDVLHERPARALRHARETLELAERLERPNERYVALSVIAYAQRQLGNLQEQQKALAALEQHGEREVAVGARGRMRTLLAELARARPALVEARGSAREQNPLR